MINVWWSNDSLIGAGLLQIFVISVATQVPNRCFQGGTILKLWFSTKGELSGNNRDSYNYCIAADIGESEDPSPSVSWNMCSAPQKYTVHRWMLHYAHTNTYGLLNTHPGVYPSDIVLFGHVTEKARGLLFFSCSSSSSSRPRGSHCYARGSERFTFNFHFSCFGSRYTCRPEVCFSSPSLPPLPALMKSQCDLFSLRCSCIHNAVWH